jgi:broad specificity phosphatase PhoE
MKYTISFLFLLLSFSLIAQNKTATKIYIVRHAEKMTDNPKERDPLLTAKGTARAESLSLFLRKKKLTAIYSTEYKRTMTTAQPTATDHGLSIQIYDSKNIKAAIQPILANNSGKNILIVGHSNTILETIEAAGGKKPIATIADEDYNNLFLVIIKRNGTIKVKAMKYGAPNSTDIKEKRTN